MGKIHTPLFSDIEYKISNGRMLDGGSNRPMGDLNKVGGKERGHIWRSLNGSKSVMFKRIVSAGTHNSRQLAGQLAYVNGKATEVFGSSVEENNAKALSDAAVAELINDWGEGWRNAYHRKNGHTSHMVLSFPKYVTERQAAMITKEWCYEMFESRQITPDSWKYYAALHTDQAHPHVHIVLNNKGRDGEWFYLGKKHHFSPDFMRERVAEIAKEHGVYLDATTRLERGIVEYAPSSGEVQRARRLGVEPVCPKREGKSLERAITKMAEYQAEYREMANVARAAKSPEMADLLEDAAERLGRGEALQLPEDPVTSIEQAQYPIDLREALLAWVARNEDKIAELEPEKRKDVTERVYGTLERIESFMQQDFALSEQEAVVELSEPKSVMPNTAEPAASKLPPKQRIFRTGGRLMEVVIGDIERLRDRAVEYLPEGGSVKRLDEFLQSGNFRSWAAKAVDSEEYKVEIAAITEAMGDFTQVDLSDVPKQLESIMARASATGIDTEQLVRRLVSGAENRHQEAEWIRGDVQAVADKRTLALNVEAHRKQAIDTVRNVYAYANEIMDKLEGHQVHHDEDEFQSATDELIKQMKAHRSVRFSDASAEKDYLLAFRAKFGARRIEALANGDLSVLDVLTDKVQAQRDITYATMKMAKKFPEVGIKERSIESGMEAYNPRIWYGRDGHAIG